jgi:hypothetical protein
MKLTDQLTPHFRAFELAQHDGESRSLPTNPETAANLQRTAEMAEALRMRWALKCQDPRLTVISGWRSPAQNERIGGAKQSQHMLGKAVDIVRSDVDWNALRHGCGTETDADKMQEFAEFVEKSIDHDTALVVVGGFGLYPGWVHLDWRPRLGNKVARWYGNLIGSEQ